MPEVVETIPITGFDAEGEPEIRQMSDGSLHVVFNFMPPSFAEDDESKFRQATGKGNRSAGAMG